MTEHHPPSAPPLQARPLTADDRPQWLALRRALWPDCPETDHADETQATLGAPERLAAFGVRAGTGELLGFAEAALRRDCVNGTETSPVAFLEGLYVVPAARRRGVARVLVQAVADWGRRRGCVELASDTPLDNAASQAVHRALGFEETERVVYFRRVLAEGQPRVDDAAARLQRYLRAYEAKDLARIAAMLADDVRLQDWNLVAEGREAVLAETRRNFEAARTLNIDLRRLHPGDDTAAAELHVTVDGHIELDVVDVLGFDEQGLIRSIRAYKG